MLFAGIHSTLIPKAYLLAQLTVCPAGNAPTVNVMLGVEKTYYNETLTAAQITKSMMGDKESTYATDSRSMLGGVTTSKLTSEVNFNYRQMSDDAGNTCVYINSANIALYYYPAIFIAKDILDKPCYSKVVKDHEQQHVDIDIKALNEYIPKIKVDMLRYLQTLGYDGFGPYTPADAEKQQAVLANNVMAASKPMVEKMREDRRERQGAIDTLENYRREQAKCPEEFPLSDAYDPE